MSNSTILLAGLPESGKTTYLAALFHLLRSGSPNEAGIVMPALPEGRDYLMEVESNWLSFESLTRTVRSAPGGADISLDRDGEPLRLLMPDIRGEDFEHLWEYGSWPEDLRRGVQNASAVMLFVRANDVDTVDFLEPAVKIVTGDSFELKDWQPEEAPTQTKLCDVLEQLGTIGRGLPIAVVVTAWDKVKSGEEPLAWLQRRLPLLWQFLTVSPVAFATFGISAQGGDLEDPSQLTALAALPNSTSRIADPAHRRGADLTTPIAWLASELR